MHAKASVDGHVVAETDKYEVVEGNIYFPPSSISAHKDAYSKTSTTTFCPWKGTASYYTLTAGGAFRVDALTLGISVADVRHVGKELKDAAWYYPQPYEKAQNIKDHVAFYKSKVKIESD
ncbi:hypothetical protein LTR66_012788 [Elasticomyces elasticus]|nr:hypothetical protein LTR66_012788 [Elasticomyces elasticus]